ncbi:sulfotransferase domain-containing protein [bacterium]|nr:sulfotransferase domain-containing protein [bacterium]
MKKPNLFIIGAPKCGTTSLNEYLRSHPNIFMCNPKEPHFFSKDLNRYPSFRSIEEYLALFQKSTDEHIVVGESSVWYLFSSVAAEEIYRFNSSSKIIVILRNPIDLIYSLHSYTYNNREDEPDFKKAFHLQGLRSQGHNLPKEIDEPLLLQYTKIGKLGDQVEKILRIFPLEKVKIILFDDFVSKTREVYEDVLSFLNVPSDCRINFPRFNKTNKSIIWLSKAKNKIPQPALDAYYKIKELLGLRKFNISGSIRRLSPQFLINPPIDSIFREELLHVFRDDIEKLSKILGRDLDQWVIPPITDKN